MGQASRCVSGHTLCLRSHVVVAVVRAALTEQDLVQVKS